MGVCRSLYAGRAAGECSNNRSPWQWLSSRHATAQVHVIWPCTACGAKWHSLLPVPQLQAELPNDSRTAKGASYFLKKRLNCFGYKLWLRHKIKPTDKPKRFKFAVNMQVRGGNLATVTGLGCCYTRPPRFQFTEALTFCLVVTTFIRFMEFLHFLGK